MLILVWRIYNLEELLNDTEIYDLWAECDDIVCLTSPRARPERLQTGLVECEGVGPRACVL